MGVFKVLVFLVLFCVLFGHLCLHLNYCSVAYLLCLFNFLLLLFNVSLVTTNIL